MTTMPTVMDIGFEAALETDAEALADLRVASMRESLERIGRFDLNRARERLLSSFDAAATRHVVVDGLRVGFFVVRSTPGELLLDHLYIEPRHQGRGLGAVVLAKVFSEADLRCLDVRVGALRESASNRFYMRHGFEPVAHDDWDIYYVRKHQGADGSAFAEAFRTSEPTMRRPSSRCARAASQLSRLVRIFAFRHCRALPSQVMCIGHQEQKTAHRAVPAVRDMAPFTLAR